MLMSAGRSVTLSLSTSICCSSAAKRGSSAPITVSRSASMSSFSSPTSALLSSISEILTFSASISSISPCGCCGWRTACARRPSSSVIFSSSAGGIAMARSIESTRS